MTFNKIPKSKTVFYKQESQETIGQELKDYISFLSGIINCSKDLIVAVDTKCRIVAYNTAYKKEMSSILENDINVGMTLDELFVNRGYELHSALVNWKKALQGIEFTVEWSAMDQDHDQKNYKITYNCIRNQRGEIIGAAHYAKKVDMAEEWPKKTGQEQVQEFVLLANSMPEIVWSSGKNGGYDFINKRASEYSGLSIETLLKIGWRDFIHHDDLEKFYARIQSFKKNSIPFEMEYRLRKHDGSYRWFMSRIVPLGVRDGEVYKYLGSAIDIHEQKLLVDKLEEKAKELQQITEAIPQLVWTTEPNGRDSYFNHRWYEYTGFSMEDSRKNGWLLALHPEDIETTERQWEQCLITGEAFYNEYRCRKFDGSFRWFIARAVPLKDHQGKIIRWFGTCTDNHDQKLQRDELNTKNQKLFQINHYLDEFVHAVAHDLRSPVAGLKLSMELLNQVEESKKGKIMEGCQTYLERLDNTLQGLVQLIEVQEESSLTKREVLDLRQMIDLVVNDLQEKIKDADAAIVLGDLFCKTIIYPKPYLYIILRNVLRYALRFRHPDQKIIFKIDSDTNGAGGMLIQIQENGQGLNLEKEMKNLFKPFSHINRGSDRKGMGLAIVKYMVEKNGGNIEVESSEGNGTTFRIFLKGYAEKR